MKINSYATGEAVRFVVRHPTREVRLWFSRARYAYREDHDALYDVAWFISPSEIKALGRVADWSLFAVLGLAVVRLSR